MSVHFQPTFFIQLAKEKGLLHYYRDKGKERGAILKRNILDIVYNPQYNSILFALRKLPASFWVN